MNVNSNDTNELLAAVTRPQRKKREPSNWGLYAAIIFANVVFALVDVISAVSVSTMTGFVLYGVLTFLAGFAPLLLHEILFTRAFASELQKKIAAIGAVVSLVSIVGIGVAAAIVNVNGANGMDPTEIELTTIIVIVFIAITHAVLSILYFYLDEGIRANQQTSQAIASAIQKAKMIQAAETILGATQAAIMKQRLIADLYNNPAAVKAVLKEMGWDQDADHDGVPDILQQRPPSATPYPVPTSRYPVRPPVTASPNGHEPARVYNADTDMPDPTHGAGRP